MGSMRTLLVVTFLLLTLPLTVLAHGGRTNAEGCHTNKKTGEYHCHSAKRQKDESNVRMHARQNARTHARATEQELTPSAATACHPSYSGCLKVDASDYDCAGGSGNGPYYTGPVRVIGPDVFGLDRDGDGWGCE